MKPQVVTLASPTWHVSASYGRYALEVRRELLKHSLHVNTIGVDAPERQYKPCFVNFIMGYPTHHHIYGGLTTLGTVIALTMWESTVLHKEWVPILNQCAAVVVPCQWNEEVFRAAGVESPIFTLPLGNSETFHYVERPERPLFRALVIGDRGERKGWLDGLLAFHQAFGDRNDVELIIKMRTAPPSGSPIANLANKNIRLIVGDYTEAQMQALYADCDVLIWGARGEAWGLPPEEFAATGGIALSTNFGGMAGQLDQWGIPIDYHMVPAWTLHGDHRGLGEWAAVDRDHLVSALQVVRNMPHSLRLALGREFARNSRSLFHWDGYGERLLDVLERVSVDANLKSA